MKLTEQYEVAAKLRRLAKRTLQVYLRWVEDFLRYQRDRSGQWVHPKDMHAADLEAFLTHL